MAQYNSEIIFILHRAFGNSTNSNIFKAQCIADKLFLSLYMNRRCANTDETDDNVI